MQTMSPPMKLEIREAQALASALGASAENARGMIDSLKVWANGAMIKACFFDGYKELKAFFVEKSTMWTNNTSLRIDFGSAPDYSACALDNPSDIRISFAQPGNWSYVGTDSIRNDLKGPSLNVEYPQHVKWESLDKDELTSLILHELGHALGLEHEHQSPEGNCETEFDWDNIYTEFAKAGWSKTDVDFNLRAKLKSPSLQVTPYDRKSIMHYYFEPKLFIRGVSSSCYVENNKLPSEGDIRFVQEVYPSSTSSQDSYLQGKADKLSNILSESKLKAEQLSQVGLELQDALSGFGRELTLEFDLTKSNARSANEAPVDLVPCDNQSTASTMDSKVACQVASNALGIVISIRP